MRANRDIILQKCACKPSEKFFGPLGSSSHHVPVNDRSELSSQLVGHWNTLYHDSILKAISIKNLPSIALAQLQQTASGFSCQNVGESVKSLGYFPASQA